MKYDNENKRIAVTYVKEDGWSDAKRAIEDECVQCTFISLAADFNVSRLHAIVGELESEFNPEANNIVISGKSGKPGKSPMIAIYWKQKSEALKKKIEKKANEKIAAP